MPIVRLVCWDPELARERVRTIKKLGFRVDARPIRTSGLIGQFRDEAPDVILIDLDRQPSHGRAVAVVVRSAKSTRHIPMVIAGEIEEKMAVARKQVPGAVFTNWAGIGVALKKAIQSGRAAGLAIRYMSQWAGRSLAEKLGFKEDMRAALLGAPDGFEEQLTGLPERVEFQDRLSAATQMALWFVRSRRDLEEEVTFIGARLPATAALWIIYPKKSGRLKTDFHQYDVRAIAQAAGFADYKICSVDSDWTGLKFGRRRY